MKSIFTEPKVAKYDNLDKPWFVYFRYNKKLFRYKFGINYIKDLKERTKEADALREALHQKLKSGWNPLLPEDVIIQQDKEMTLSEALDFGLKKKKTNLAYGSYLAYKSTINFCQQSIKSLKLSNLLITETKRAHIKLVFEKISEGREWSNYAYNSNLLRIKAVLSEVVQWGVIEYNPAHKIKGLIAIDSKANRSPSSEEHQKIKQKLESEYPDFYIFVITIFHTGIRPEEITKIKLAMIDLQKQQIVLPPNIQKTRRKERVVPVNSHLLSYFKKMGLEKYPPDHYLFGRGFVPSFYKIRRQTATSKWCKIVKDELGINVNMYAMKHFGADQKILAGIDLDALRELYGHSSKQMTMKYAKGVKEVYRNEIMEKSPEF